MTIFWPTTFSNHEPAEVRFYLRAGRAIGHAATHQVDSRPGFWRHSPSNARASRRAHFLLLRAPRSFLFTITTRGRPSLPARTPFCGAFVLTVRCPLATSTGCRLALPYDEPSSSWPLHSSSNRAARPLKRSRSRLSSDAASPPIPKRCRSRRTAVPVPCASPRLASATGPRGATRHGSPSRHR
jgi:hypothetical protein